MSDAEMTGKSDENEGANATQPEIPSPSLAGSIDPQSIEGIFLRAVQLIDPTERAAFLDAQCADEDERNRVTALLRAYDDAGSFLENPASGPRPSDDICLDFLTPCEEDDCLGLMGTYRILEVIGTGGMGVVLRAMDPKLNRIVAVKVLLPELARNPNARRRFHREAQAAAAISHPHVVTIHAVEEAQPDTTPPSPPFLVMECVVGQSLQEQLDAVGPLRLAEILRISRQVAEGLGAAHQQGLIHRDIKPANILLENGVQRVKITDFGLARATDDLSVTMTGEVSGTPQYMSPEQATGERIDHRSDLFSLGCVMYAMCTGHSPFRAKNLAHVIQRVTQDTPRGIGQQNPEIPNWLEQIIRCLLEKSPEHRFQSAEGLVAILDQHLSRLQQPALSGSHSMINLELPTALELPSKSTATVTQARSAAVESQSHDVPTHDDQHRVLGSLALTVFAALMLGGALSFATISERLIRENMQRVEATLILALIGTAAITAITCIGVFIKHGTTSITKLRTLQTTLLLGTIYAGYVWSTFVRSPNASAHDFRALGFLTLLWVLFCLYAGKVWTEANEEAKSLMAPETIHGRVGRYLIVGGFFFTMLPIALITVGLVLSDGDLMQAGGQFLVVAMFFSLLAIAAGYVLRYIIDTQPQYHRPIGVWLATLLAIGTAMG
ncbi:MAG: serine/threonine-protein kinase, partial [Rubripirellula sp.]